MVIALYIIISCTIINVILQKYLILEEIIKIKIIWKIEAALLLYQNLL